MIGISGKEHVTGLVGDTLTLTFATPQGSSQFLSHRPDSIVVEQGFPRFVEQGERVTLGNVEINRMAVRAFVDINPILDLTDTSNAGSSSPFFKLAEG